MLSRSLLVWGALEGGTILKSADGRTWTALESGGKELLNGVWGSSSKDIYIAGSRGTILRSADGGASWLRQESGTTTHLRSPFGGAPGACVAGNAGLLLCQERAPEKSGP